MKIAIMAPLVTAIREPQLGGSQAFVSDLARGLAGRGHDVHVYAASGSDIPGVEVIDTGVDPESLGATLYRAFAAAPGPRAAAPGPRAAAPGPRAADTASTAESTDPAEAAGGSHTVGAAENARRAAGVSGAFDAAEAAFAAAYVRVRESRYDLIHNHAFDAPAVRLAGALGAPVVHTLHLPPDDAVAAAVQDATRSARPPAIAAVSAFQAGQWRRIVQVDAILGPFVPTGVIPWSQAAGLGAVFAGRLSPEKGAAEAIDIAAAAGMPVDVYGGEYDAAYSSEQIGPRRAQPGVTLHEPVPRATLWTIMARAAVVLFPARWDEPFGMAAAEAQACGTPVVAFRCGALGEVIADGVTGFLVPPDDIQAAARAARKAGGISRRACREHAERHLDLERSLDAHERLYRRLTG